MFVGSWTNGSPPIESARAATRSVGSPWRSRVPDADRLVPAGFGAHLRPGWFEENWVAGY